jgi:putative ABC transport system substrate-binding protein
MRRREFIALVTAGWLPPFPVSARQKSLPVIGYLHFDKPGGRLHEAFLEGLKDTGYVEGQNVAVEYRWAEGRYDRSQVLAAELVARKVDVIIAPGPPLARAAKDATSTIPIVFEVGNDAVEAGLVKSLAHPGGNATGLNVLFTQLTPKLLELVSELVPHAKIVGLLVNPNSPTAEPTIRAAEGAARARDLQLHVLKARTADDIENAFTTLASLHGDALVVGPDPFLGSQRLQLVAGAAEHKLPAIYFSDGFTSAGGLISYGPNLATIYRRMGVYAGKILKGEYPANLPVEQPTKFDLLINLKTARALGLTVPPSMLGRADEVIE